MTIYKSDAGVRHTNAKNRKDDKEVELMKKRNLKGNNKGFTLVELIVVLVILAILAAILVPALLGYIDSARGKQSVINARSALIAAQAEMSTIYASKSAYPADIANAPHKDNVKNTADFTGLNPECTLFEVGCDEAYTSTSTEDRKLHHKAFTITWAHYQDGTSDLYYSNGEWADYMGDTTSTKPTATSGAYTVYQKTSTFANAGFGFF